MDAIKTHLKERGRVKRERKKAFLEVWGAERSEKNKLPLIPRALTKRDVRDRYVCQK